jgi:hypothetical protein
VDAGTSAVQFSHDAPFCPHCVSMKPAWQVPVASQHPAQFEAVHVGGGPPHAWFSQLWPEASQFVQAAPPVPQSVSRSPGRQACPSQHPAGHVSALHVGGGGVVQTPLAHWPPLDAQS